MKNMNSKNSALKHDGFLLLKPIFERDPWEPVPDLTVYFNGVMQAKTNDWELVTYLIESEEGWTFEVD